MKARWTGLAVAGAIAAGVVGSVASVSSCAQTPTNVPVRTFDRPQSVEVVCLQVADPVTGAPMLPVPQPEAQCAPVPPNVTGSTLPFHLFALVTQATNGEVAVVDLTAGAVVDVNAGVPGINFLPVGELPSDIAVAPDGAFAYVGSASPNKPAIYALDTHKILGDSVQGLPSGTVPVIPSLTTWPVCSLPQAPGAIRVVPYAAAGPAAGAADAGADASDAGGDASDAGGDASEAGADAGDAAADAAGADAGDAGAEDAGAGDAGVGGASTGAPAYQLAVVFPGSASTPARVGLVDPTPLQNGQVAPGSLAPCTITSYFDLKAPAAGTTWSPGPAWDDGVKYVDAAVSADQPTAATSCVTPFDAGPGGVTPVAGLTGASPFAGPAALDRSGPTPYLYVADAALPLVHVIDLSNPSHIVERAPLLATSAADPLRAVSVGQIAVSPPTRDYKRFLYGIDRKEGSVMVWDVTDGAQGPRVPLQRPHPELEPFQPPDRVLFNAPAAALSFVRHDWPLTNGASGTGAFTGVLCNPNPNIDTATPGVFADLGGNYRGNVTVGSPGPQIGLGPYRLRGIFAIVTLSNGQVATLDVDDWDAPCRRPDPLASPGTVIPSTAPDGGATVSPLLAGPFNAIAPPEPAASGPKDFDPYHAPVAFKQGLDTDNPVSLEAFFPVSAPHRVRSAYLLRNDPTSGDHIPHAVAVPQLQQNGAPVAQVNNGITSPVLVPTDTAYVDPSLQSTPTTGDPSQRTISADAGGASLPTATPGVRFQYEEPQAHIDQAWSVTFEGRLPRTVDSNGRGTLVANLTTGDGFQTLSLSNPSGGFCGTGVEDYALGQERAVTELKAMAGLKKGAAIARLDHRIADYVEVTDDLLPQGDPYWTDPHFFQTCWDEVKTAGAAVDSAHPVLDISDPYGTCSTAYASPYDPTNVSKERQFPILTAKDGTLVVGRFGSTAPAPREVVSADGSNVRALGLMKCCFHNQVSFDVRTGGQWAVVGSATGFLHHIIPSGADARCAPSCEARDVLLNGRAPMVPYAVSTSGGTIGRDSPLAFRNPMFSFVVWDGHVASGDDAVPGTDMTWTFSTQGGLQPLVVSLAATTIAVSPQSMRFINSLGQIAIVDGSSQGLILIDLNTVQEAHAPYF